MKAGHELDALVAEKMGKEVWDGIRAWEEVQRFASTPEFRGNWVNPTKKYLHTGAGNIGEIPRYSSDISAAFEVVEELAKRDMWIDLADMRHGCYSFDGSSTFVGWRAEVCDVDRDDDEHGPFPVTHNYLPDDETWTAYADTAPLAMCLAALKALGVD